MKDKKNPLAERRRKAQNSWDGPNNVHHRRYADAMREFEKTAEYLSQDITRFILERVEDAIPNTTDFKKIMYRIFLRVLRKGAERPEPVFLLDDETVPGFSLMLFKKQDYQHISPNEIGMEEELDESPSIELKAASIIVTKFVERTGNSVITIETNDVVFVFFPSSDLKKNLDELGLSLE